jgi:hypothetical protein
MPSQHQKADHHVPHVQEAHKKGTDLPWYDTDGCTCRPQPPPLTHLCGGIFIQENAQFDTLLDLLPKNLNAAIFEVPNQQSHHLAAGHTNGHAQDVLDEGPPGQVKGAARGRGRAPLTHAQLHEFVESAFPALLRRCGVENSDVVGVSLPNGPELGVCVIACMSWAACAPVNVDLTPEEMMSDLQVSNHPLSGCFFRPLLLPWQFLASVCVYSVLSRAQGLQRCLL